MQNWLFYAEQNEIKQYLYQIQLTIFFHISPPKKKNLKKWHVFGVRCVRAALL